MKIEAKQWCNDIADAIEQGEVFDAAIKIYYKNYKYVVEENKDEKAEYSREHFLRYLDKNRNEKKMKGIGAIIYSANSNSSNYTRPNFTYYD